jgi:hypothetical protein
VAQLLTAVTRFLAPLLQLAAALAVLLAVQVAAVTGRVRPVLRVQQGKVTTVEAAQFPVMVAAVVRGPLVLTDKQMTAAKAALGCLQALTDLL